MTNTIRLWVYDRPGVLDSITGLIRRKGVNIRTLTAGDTEEGISQITISIKEYIDVEKLGDYFSEMSIIKSWEKCRPDTHIVKELLLLRFESEHKEQIIQEGMRIIEEQGNIIFAAYVAEPLQIDDLLQQLRQYKIQYTRTGALALSYNEGNEGLEEADG